MSGLEAIYLSLSGCHLYTMVLNEFYDPIMLF